MQQKYPEINGGDAFPGDGEYKEVDSLRINQISARSPAVEDYSL